MPAHTFPETRSSSWASRHVVIRHLLGALWSVLGTTFYSTGVGTQGNCQVHIHLARIQVISKFYFHSHLEMEQAITQKGSPKVSMRPGIGKGLREREGEDGCSVSPQGTALPHSFQEGNKAWIQG